MKPENVVIAAGTVVTLVGLVKGDNNGRMGTVEGEKEGRYDVRLDGGRVVRVKRRNVVV